MSNLPSGADLDAHQADETARAATAGPEKWTLAAEIFVDDANLRTVCTPMGDTPEIRRSRAALIAAAPDLYEALEAFVRSAESWHECHDHETSPVQCDAVCACIPAARAALKKARNQ